jgi:hypothetical protein
LSELAKKDDFPLPRPPACPLAGLLQGGHAPGLPTPSFGAGGALGGALQEEPCFESENKWAAADKTGLVLCGVPKEGLGKKE